MFKNLNFYILAIDNILGGFIKRGEVFKVKKIHLLDFEIRKNGNTYFVDEALFVKYHKVKLHNLNKYKSKKKFRLSKKYRSIIRNYNGVSFSIAGSINKKFGFK